MSWKNTQQNSFSDSLVIEHKSLSELDDVHNIHAHPTLSETTAFAVEMAEGTITDLLPPKKR